MAVSHENPRVIEVDDNLKAQIEANPQFGLKLYNQVRSGEVGLLNDQDKWTLEGIVTEAIMYSADGFGDGS